MVGVRLLISAWVMILLSRILSATILGIFLSPPAPILAYPSSVIGDGNLGRNVGGFWAGRFDASFVALALAD